MGRRCVEEMIKHHPDRILHIYLLSSLQDREFLQVIKFNHLSHSFVNKGHLFSLTNSESHQGIVAKIKERNYCDIDEFLSKEKERSLVLMLDGIEDPQNFGAIARSAACFNISGLIWSKNRGADITPVAAKTACGGFELMDLIKVSNLASSVEKFKKFDYDIVSADVNEKGEVLDNFVFASKTLLIVGSEKEGIRPLLKKMTSRFVYIPMLGKISSLNVAQATSVLLYSWQSKNFPGKI